MTASAAFAPGHVSGLFAVHDEHPDVLRKGSRGAGWSIDKGATAIVRPGVGRVTAGGQPFTAPVTHRALNLLDSRTRELDVELRLDLPSGQGFGMSAAGTLAACLAAADLLDLEPEAALAATHQAEVESGTGLGDAIGAWLGGAEVRIAPGIPPHGGALRIEAEADFLFCTFGAGIATPSIIRDARWKARTRQLGDAAVDRIVAAGRAVAWETLLLEAHDFSLGLGLMPDGMRRAGQALPAGVMWGQAMLGTTLWATGPRGKLDAAAGFLSSQGSVISARLDANGARLVRAP